MYMKSIFVFFLSLGLGYLLCVSAKKQEGVLKTVGYTLGISILVLTLGYGMLRSYSKQMMCHPMMKMHGKMMMGCPMMKMK